MNQPSTTADDDRLIDFEEVSRLLGGISERTIRRLIAAGELPQPVRIRRSPRLYHSEVVAYLEQLKRKRNSKPKHPFSP